MDFAFVQANLERVREEIARTQAAHGLAGPVRIVAVTKGRSVDAIEAGDTAPRIIDTRGAALGELGHGAGKGHRVTRIADQRLRPGGA